MEIRFRHRAVEVNFCTEDKAAHYLLIKGTLVRFCCISLCKQGRGLVLRYLQRVSDYAYTKVKR